jgi:hypothetical protein
MTYLPFLDEVGQLRKEIPPRTVIGRIFTIKRHNIIVALLHVLQEDLHLLCLSSSLFRMFLNFFWVFIWLQLGLGLI